MNPLAITLIIMGIFLILVGVLLLVVRFQTSESENSQPIFQGPGRIMVSGPVGLVVIVVGVVCLGFAGAAYKISGNGNSPDSGLSTSPSATLTSPISGAGVSRSEGFTASGKVWSLGSDTIWILDYDGGYTVDQKAIVTAGRWSASDHPLGDSSNHLPYSLTMVAALANHACAVTLTRTNATSNDYLTQLPSGCKLFGQVTVNVARP